MRQEQNKVLQLPAFSTILTNRNVTNSAKGVALNGNLTYFGIRFRKIERNWPMTKRNAKRRRLNRTREQNKSTKHHAMLWAHCGSSPGRLTPGQSIWLLAPYELLSDYLDMCRSNKSQRHLGW